MCVSARIMCTSNSVNRAQNNCSFYNLRFSFIALNCTLKGL